MSNELQRVEVPGFVTDAEALAAGVRLVEITDAATLGEAADWAARLDEAFKQAEKAREFLVKPLNDHVRAINATFKPRTTAIKAGLSALKSKMADYHAEAQRAEQAAARAAAEFVGASPEVQDIVASKETNQVVRTEAAAVSTSERWDYEVVDLRRLAAAVASGRMPVDLIQPDRGALRRWLNALDKAGMADDIVVEGVRVHKVKDVRLG